MRIGIVYGHISSNYGDIAINHGTAAMLQKLAPHAHVHVVLLNLPESQLAALNIPLQSRTPIWHRNNPQPSWTQL